MRRIFYDICVLLAVSVVIAVGAVMYLIEKVAGFYGNGKHD